MNRIMGDATSENVSSIPGGVQLVAGYDTGSPSIKWNATDWARFPGMPHVHIDQGFGTVRSHSANVLDVETGAFTPSDLEIQINMNSSPRPTVYCNRGNLSASIANAQRSPKWKGDIWLAFPNWQPGDSLPSIPSNCRYVAIQNTYRALYDLSTVLDEHWPLEAPARMFTIPGIPGSWQSGQSVLIDDNADGSIVVTGTGTDGNIYYVKAVAGKWGVPTRI